MTILVTLLSCGEGGGRGQEYRFLPPLLRSINAFPPFVKDFPPFVKIMKLFSKFLYIFVVIFFNLTIP